LHDYLTWGEWKVETVSDKKNATRYKIQNGVIKSGLTQLYVNGSNEIDCEVDKTTHFQFYRKIPTNAIGTLTMHVTINGKKYDIPVSEDNYNSLSKNNIYSMCKLQIPCFINDLPSDTVLTFTATPVSVNSTVSCNSITVGEVKNQSSYLDITINTDMGEVHQYYLLSPQEHKGDNTSKNTYTISEATCVSPRLMGHLCRGYYQEVRANRFVGNPNLDYQLVQLDLCDYELPPEFVGNKSIYKHAGERVEYSKNATCKEDGITGAIMCNACGEILREGTVVPHSDEYHVWVEKAINNNSIPNCKNSYTVVRQCTECHKTEWMTKKGTHQNENVEAVAATHFTEGYTAGTKCTVCGRYTSGHEVIPVIDHDWDEGEVIEASGCENTGVKLYKCKFGGCNATKTEATGEVGHTLITVEKVDPTCTQKGMTEYKECTVCGVTIGKEEIPAGHKVVIDEALAPTCMKAGKTEGSHCSACDLVISEQEEIDALGHEYDNGTVTQAHSCVTDKIVKYTCTRDNCGHEYSVVTEKATGHSYKESIVTPVTCEKDGYVRYTCKNENCNSTYVDAVTAIGHNYDEGVVTKQPATSEEGERKYTCLNDKNHQYTEKIEKLPVQEQPSQDQPSQEQPSQNQPSQEQPSQGQPPQEQPVQNPVVEVPAQQPVQETPGRQQPVQETPAAEPEITPVEEAVAVVETEIVEESVPTEDKPEIAPAEEKNETIEETKVEETSVEEEAVPEAAAPNNQSFIWIVVLLVVLVVLGSGSYAYIRNRKSQDSAE